MIYPGQCPCTVEKNVCAIVVSHLGKAFLKGMLGVGGEDIASTSSSQLTTSIFLAQEVPNIQASMGL